MMFMVTEREGAMIVIIPTNDIKRIIRPENEQQDPVISPFQVAQWERVLGFLHLSTFSVVDSSIIKAIQLPLFARNGKSAGG